MVSEFLDFTRLLLYSYSWKIPCCSPKKGCIFVYNLEASSDTEHYANEEEKHETALSVEKTVNNRKKEK